MEKVSVTLCSLCARQVAGEEAVDVVVAENSYNCFLCFGILDENFIQEVANEVEKQLTDVPYDASSFILALNLPVSQTLREALISKLRPDFKGILADVPFKIRNINAYISKLSETSGLRPTLQSDLQLTITFANSEFDKTDLAYLTGLFPNDFRQGKKRQYDNAPAPTECSKGQLQQVVNRITEEQARKYTFVAPSAKCSFSLNFERDPIFLGGRYCKFSRRLPQSPWSCEEKGGAKEAGNSVSEKICDALKECFGASDSTFIASGREDIDVRMLGEGRPFAVELKNCRITKPLHGDSYIAVLNKIENEINAKFEDIKVNYLTRVTRQQAEQLTVGEEEKRKCYTAYCYTSLPLPPGAFQKALSQIPVEIIQKTPVRVLKRRALLDRPRNIYSLELLKKDDHHFLARMETQAGTYIKEFVHGDFGRTTPSLGELLGVAEGEVDILDLDVEKVDLEWPPNLDTPNYFK